MTRKLINTIVYSIKKIFHFINGIRLLWKFRLFWKYCLRHMPSKVWISAFSILLKIKRNIAETRYDHRNHVEPNKGIYEVDCSGFVNHVLDIVHPKALLEVQEFSQNLQDYPKPKEENQPWPLHYMLFLQSKDSQKPKRHWKSIENALELKPGDIIAYAARNVEIQKKLSPAMGTIQKDYCSERGQHVMIVSGPIQPETGWVWVPVFDSTKIPHGPKDMRGKEGGIGNGMIGLELDPKKAPIHLKWSDASRSVLNRNIRMGRVHESE